MGYAVDSGPADDGVAIVAHATNEQPVGRGLYVGTGGDLIVRFHGRTVDVTFKNVPSGALLPIRPKYIRATSTAADIVALF